MPSCWHGGRDAAERLAVSVTTVPLQSVYVYCTVTVPLELASVRFESYTWVVVELALTEKVVEPGKVTGGSPEALGVSWMAVIVTVVSHGRVFCQITPT